MTLFADDTKIFRESNNFLQTTLGYIYKWLTTRKLDLNPDKFKVLTFKKNKPFGPINLLINNTKMPKV